MAPGLRILQVSPYYYPEVQFGGPPRKILGLATGLIGSGCAVSAICFLSDNREASHSRQVDGVHVQYLPWLGWGTRQIATRASLLRQAVAQADIVHAFGLYNFLSPLAGRLARESGRTFVIEPLGNYRPRARNQWAKKLYHRVFTGRMFAEAAAVIATSEAEQADLKAAVLPRKLFVRPNGVELPPAANPEARTRFRKRLQIAEDELLFLFAGRLSPIKNLETLITSFALAHPAKAKLVLAGPLTEASYVARLKVRIQDLKMGERALVIGPVYGPDKDALYAAADVFVLPSLSESYGNAAAEAVAAGLPVLLTETCGIAPLLNGVAGLAVACEETALTEGLRKIARSEVRQQYAGAWRLLEPKLSWAGTIRTQMAIYAQTLGAQVMSSG